MKEKGSDAFVRTLRNPARRYPARDDARSIDGMIFPALSPSFTLTPGETVFAIGSCFARNVEDALVRRGFDVPTAGFRAPEAEAPGRPNRILNQYNPATMLQCIEDTVLAGDSSGLYPAADGQVVDALLATGGRAVSLARAEERRDEIRTLYGAGLAAAGTVIITLGLIEAWYDTEHALWLNEAPPGPLLRRDTGRFEFHRLGTSQAGEMVDRLLSTLTATGRRVILTVSPVPLQTTFAEGCAVSRNAYSKAVLRVVAEEAALRHDRVDYFPSYEIVTLKGLAAFGEDQVHVRAAVIEKVIAHMTGAYIEAPSLAAE